MSTRFFILGEESKKKFTPFYLPKNRQIIREFMEKDGKMEIFLNK